ncbi:MAG: exo-alpha-sialidase, partial [Dehalococcoidia bacterium]|nr:exo-alpha-sialidase [Dehalococcoidia bacterium]
MIKARSAVSLSAWLVLALLVSLLPTPSIKPALAHPAELRWSIVDTPAPGQATNIIVSPSEINAIAIGWDGTTFYAVDTPNSRVHKSDDGGITWEDELSGSLTADGANLPAWNIAVAPDDVNFVVAVTDNGTGAPREVFVSRDGGTKWENTGLDATLTANGDAGSVG